MSRRATGLLLAAVGQRISPLLSAITGELPAVLSAARCLSTSSGPAIACLQHGSRPTCAPAHQHGPRCSCGSCGTARSLWTSSPSLSSSDDLIKVLKEEVAFEKDEYKTEQTVAAGPPAPFTLSEQPLDTMLTLRRSVPTCQQHTGACLHLLSLRFFQPACMDACLSSFALRWERYTVDCGTEL